MHLFARRLVSSIVSFAIAFGPVAEAAAAAGADSYFRYRIDGVDAQGIHVMLRGPETPVVSGSPISVRTRVLGGSAPYTFALETGTLPPGLAVAAGSGDIDGLATEAGVYDFTVRATDVNGSTAVSQPFRVAVQYRKLEIVRTPSLSARKDQAYSDRLSAAGGKEPYAWSVAEGVLPSGVTLDQGTGVLAGTPTSVGQFPFRARVADAAGANAVTGQLVLFVDAAALSIAGSSPTNGNVGSMYTGRFEAAGGAPPYTYVLPAGALPPGVSLDGGTGWVRGVPSVPGLYPNIKVRAVDSTRRYADSAAFSVNVFADLAASWEGQTAVRDVAYSGTVKAYGGRAPYSYLLTAGELPVGLSLNGATGVVSGTPTVGTEANGLDVRVTDASGKSVQTGRFSISVSNKLTIVSAPSRGAVRGQNYSSGFATGGGTRPYGYRLVKGTLPTGLSLGGSTGVISGAPSTIGTASGLQVQVTDAVGDNALSPLFDIEVLEAIRASIAAVPTYGTVGKAYSGIPALSGGRSPYMVSLDGILPSGLSFEPSTGAVTGTPSAAGTSGDLALTVVDQDGRSGVTQSFRIRISNPLTVGSPVLRGMVGENYNSGASITGGAAPFVVQATKGLPAGLALDDTNGRITGRPVQAGTLTGFQIRVADADGRIATTTAQDFVVSAPFVLSAPTPAFGTVGQPYAGSVTVAGGTAPYAIRIGSGSLPAGLSIDGATGSITGTPSTVDGGAFVLAATDAAGRSVQINASIPVSETIAFTGGPSASASVGVDYASQASTTGGRRPFSWTVSSGQLPDGLTLNPSSGAITGSPGQEGAYGDIALIVVDTDGRSATSPVYSIDVRRPLVVAGAPADTASTGVRYEEQLQADGGIAPYSWTLASGRLPGGIALDAQGLLAGTPSQGGTYSFAVAVTDAAGRRAVSRSYGLTVTSDFTIVADGLPTDLTTGVAMSKTFQVQGGDAPVAFSQSGTLPAGLAFDVASGTLSGTPTTSGSYSVSVSARDGSGRVSSTGAFSIDVSAPLTISGNPASGATFSRFYAARFPVAGGKGPYSYTSIGNGLPPGLSLSSAIDAVTKAPFGSLSGTPTAPGTFSGLVVQAVDAVGRTATSAPFSIEVVDRFTVAASVPASATVGQDFVGRIAAADGAAPYQYALTGGTLPQGLQFDGSTGEIAGKPSAPGTQTGLVFTATDVRGRTASTDPVVVDVRSPIAWSVAAPSFSIVGEPLFAKGTITGGRAPFTASVSQGFLPPGISFDGTTGDLSGTPTQSGSYSAQVIVRDADGRSSPATGVGLPVAGPLVIATANGQSRIPQAWTRGKAFVGSFVATGGHTPYKWTLIQGTLPHGLSVDVASGAVVGTPDQVESRSGLVVQVADADGRNSVSAPFSIAVSDNPSFASLPGGYPTVGTSFSASPAVLGGTAPYSFALASGSVLPAGLDLDAATGTVSGTPSAAGAANLVLTVSDSLGATGQGAFTLDVRNPLALPGSFAAAATNGTYYSSSIGIAGGRSPVTVAIESGSAPAGLDLSVSSTNIYLSGTPVSSGMSTLSIAATDADGRTAHAGPFSIDVREKVVVSGSLPSVTVGHAYSASFNASGGRPGYTFRTAGAALPAGLALDPATGVVGGTPTASGTVSGLRIQALDADQRLGETGSLSLTVRDRIAPTGMGGVQVGTVGAAFSFAQSFTGGSRPFGYSLSSGALPQGLSLDTATGVVSGTPTTAASTQGLAITAADADGDTATGASFSIDVRTAVAVQAPSEILVETQTDGTWGSVSASGGAGSYAFAVSSGKLPDGLLLDVGTGVLSGRTETPADVVVRVSATDAQGRIGRSGDIRVKADPAVTVATSQPAQAQVGKSYSAYPMTASGGTPPYAYDLPKGALPSGLSLDAASGRIFGTPTLAGTYAFDLRVIDADGRSATRPFTVPAVDPLAVVYPLGGRGAFVVAKASSYIPTVTGGCLPVASSIYAGGGLPAGIVEKNVGGFSYDGSDGLQTGSFNYIVRIQDACSNVVDNPVTLNVASSSPQVAVPARTTLVRSAATTLPPAVVSGGSSPFSYELAGTVPAGVSIDAETGVISGTVANAAGTNLGPVSVTVFDAYGRQAASPSFTLRVVDPVAISYRSAQLPFAVGMNSSYAPVVSGGCGTPVYSIEGSAPVALGFASGTGVLSNGGFTSADIGSYGPISVKVVDACSIQSTVSLGFDVRGGAPSASGTATSYFVVGQTGTTGPVQATNMASPTFAITVGTLPNGLSFDASTGTISGTFPASTSAGSSYVFTITASDAYGRTASTGNVRINAVTQPTVAFQNGGKVGLVAGSTSSIAPTVTGGCSVSSYALKSGALPTGMSLNATNGAIAGTPSATGQFGPATVELTDTCTQKATATVSFDVQSITAAVTAPSQRTLVIGKASTTDAATWAGFASDAVTTISGGNLPTGISFDGSKLSGTLPASTSAGASFGSYQIRVADSWGRVALSTSFILTAANPATIVYANTSAATVGSAFTLQPAVASGAAPYTYALSSGSLAAGLSLSTTTGAITGTPTAAKTATNYTVTVTDAAGVQSVSNTFTITATDGVVVAGTPGVASQGQSYSYTFTASGGQSPYTFSTSGTLPPGLSMSTGGVLSGTATASATYGFTVVATDAAARTGSLGATLTVKTSSNIGNWYSWGAGEIGRGSQTDRSYSPVVASALPRMSQVSIFRNTGCGIADGGGVVCWGLGTSGQLGNGGTTSSEFPVAVSGGQTFTQISAGQTYNCGITTGGDLYCWGNGSGGKVGFGDNANKTVPTLIAAGAKFVSVSAGVNAACAIRNTGGLMCWGADTALNINSAYPAPFGSETWTQIAVSNSVACGVTSDGALKCWGTGYFGATGQGAAAADSKVPLQVSAARNWVSSFVTQTNGCGLNTLGEILCWGTNGSGALGRGLDNNNFVGSPAQVTGTNTFAKLRGSYLGTYCGIATDGRMLCWGNNASSLVGDGTTTNCTVPTPPIGAQQTFADLAMGYEGSYGLPNGSTGPAPTGKAYGWGALASLGYGGTGFSSTPVSGIGGGLAFRMLSTTYTHACGIRSDDNTGVCWGQNSSGQLGNGDSSGTTKTGPVAIAGNRKWAEIKAGYMTSCGISDGGQLFCWGNGYYGSAGTGSDTKSSITSPNLIGASGWSRLAMGTQYAHCAFQGYNLWCWGNNAGGMVGNNSSTAVLGLTQVSGYWNQASVSDSNVCAIKIDGTLWCWGDNSYRQFGIASPTTAKAPVAVQASSTWLQVAVTNGGVCAIRSDSRLFCWGNNQNVGSLYGDAASATPMAKGASATPTEVYGGGTWASVKAGHGYSQAFCGVRQDGSTSCWGSSTLVPGATKDPSPMLTVDPSLNLYNVTLGWTTSTALQ